MNTTIIHRTELAGKRKSSLETSETMPNKLRVKAQIYKQENVGYKNHTRMQKWILVLINKSLFVMNLTYYFVSVYNKHVPDDLSNTAETVDSYFTIHLTCWLISFWNNSMCYMYSANKIGDLSMVPILHYHGYTQVQVKFMISKVMILTDIQQTMPKIFGLQGTNSNDYEILKSLSKHRLQSRILVLVFTLWS